MERPTLVIGAKHQVLTDALEIVLSQQGFAILGATLTLADLRSLVSVRQPRLCLTDRWLCDGDALEAVGDLLASSPLTKVVVLTDDREQDAVALALQLGATGYLHKTHGVSSLVSALRRVDAGEIVVDTVAPQQPTTAATHVRWRATYLTGREFQCLTLLVEGLSTGAMARRLGVSPTTLRGYVQGVMNKLGVHSRLEAAALAVRYSLLNTGPQLPARRPTPPGTGGAGSATGDDSDQRVRDRFAHPPPAPDRLIPLSRTGSEVSIS
jgi:DNA-binding NarL/FixJ family response regulator